MYVPQYNMSFNVRPWSR